MTTQPTRLEVRANMQLTDEQIIDMWNRAMGSVFTLESRALAFARALLAAAPAQSAEPVAIVDENDEGKWADILPNVDVKVGQKLYTSPQPSPTAVVLDERAAFDLWMENAKKNGHATGSWAACEARAVSPSANVAQGAEAVVIKCASDYASMNSGYPQPCDAPNCDCMPPEPTYYWRDAAGNCYGADPQPTLYAWKAPVQAPPAQTAQSQKVVAWMNPSTGAILHEESKDMGDTRRTFWTPLVAAQSALVLDERAHEWAPARIWLQREQGEGGSHTWCEDSVGDEDLIEEAEYVRVGAPSVKHTEFPYQRTFDAIAAATSTSNNTAISISVRAFQEAYNAGEQPVEQTRALTDEQIREIALKYCTHEMLTRTYNILRYECEEDFFNLVRELTAARPASGETE